MAPQQATSRMRHRQPIHSNRPHITRTETDLSSTTSRETAFAGNKSDRRQIKRSLLLSKAALSSDRRPSRISKSATKRREKVEKQRKRETLAADLGALADVLESSIADGNGNTRLVGSSSSKATRARAVASNTKSIKSKSGMQKRKAAIASLERQRMGKNLAIMSEVKPSQSEESSSSNVDTSRTDKWAALRRHIVMANSKMDNASVK